MSPEEAIHFFSEDTDYLVSKQADRQTWLAGAINQEGKDLGPISIIICSDEYLHKMNVEYLEHDDLTDVITFDYSEGKKCSGDLFLSIDRIRENASHNDVGEENELSRVMVHGVLHLLGYKDKTPEQASEIRSKEDYYLSLHAF
jgi:probable rRNA maturation factor